VAVFEMGYVISSFHFILRFYFLISTLIPTW